MLDIRKRTGWIFFAAMIAQILLVSAQVQTKSGTRALQAVTFEVFSRIEFGTASVVNGARSTWGNYVGLRGVKGENETLKRRVAELEVQLQQEHALATKSAHQVALAGALVVVGAVPAVWAFVRLVPSGTVRLRPGLPAAVAARGVLTFAFFGADAYVSLAVTDGHDAPTWVAGLALTGATLAWTTGAWVQQRLVLERGPRWLVRRGFAVIGVGIACLALALRPGVPVAATVVAWTIAGLGMGLSYAPISVTVLGTAEPGQEGRASASLQLTDVLGVALGTGLGGVFVALGDGRGWATSSSLTIAFAMTFAVAVGGVVAAGRLPQRLPGVEATD